MQTRKYKMTMEQINEAQEHLDKFFAIIESLEADFGDEYDKVDSGYLADGSNPELEIVKALDTIDDILGRKEDFNNDLKVIKQGVRE